MEMWVLWVIVGLVLVIAELVTGTFYLLVLGVGAFAFMFGQEGVEVSMYG